MRAVAQKQKPSNEQATSNSVGKKSALPRENHRTPRYNFTAIPLHSNIPVHIQAKPDAGGSSQAGPTSNFERTLQQAVHSGGKPLHAPTQSFMENRFGYDFSTVRVHHDNQAAALSQQVNARAFTFKNNIFFGPSQYQPDSSGGQRLIAHELAHTLQQGKAGTTIQRAVTDYSVEEEQDISVENVKAANSKSYWGEKLAVGYELMLEESMKNLSVQVQNEILGGVAAKLPATPPAKGEDRSTQMVQVPVGSPPTNYVVFVKVVPRSKEETDATAKPQLYVDSIGSGAQVVPEEVGNIPKDGNTSSPDVDSRGFRNQPDDFYTAYKEEIKRLNYWFNTKADTSKGFTKTLKVTTTVGAGNDAKQRTTVFVIRYTTDSGSRDLEFFFQGSDAIPVSAPAAGTAEKTGPSFEIEGLQNDPKDKIGTVDLSGVPTNERASVEHAIIRYFKDAKARSTEVDSVVPINDTGTWINYTLIFDTTKSSGVSTTNIKAVRIGAGKEPTDTTQAVALDITKVNGFPATETDPAKLTAWITARYPAITITKNTVTEIVDEANATIGSDAKNKAWFLTNYGLTVLDAAGTADRLEKKHKVAAAKITGTKDYSSEELTHLELAFQQFSSTMLTKWRDVSTGRQEKSSTSASNTAGQAYTNGSDHTVMLYDSAFGKGVTFIGSTNQVMPTSIFTITHEFGHIAEHKQATARTKFDAFVKAEGIKQFTWYARSDKSEFFPEAFGLYYSDPEWMKTNHPKLHEWFKKYDETGNPP